MVTAHTRPVLPTQLFAPRPVEKRTEDDSEEEDEVEGDDDVQRRMVDLFESDYSECSVVWIQYILPINLLQFFFKYFLTVIS